MDRRLIATIGMFDGVHLGHRFLIDFLRSKASGEGHIPTVFTFDRHPLSIIKPEIAPRQLSTISERAELLHQAGAERVEILSFDEAMRTMSAEQFITMLRDRYDVTSLILGFNNRIGHDRISSIEQYQAIGNQLGVKIIQAPEYAGSIEPVSSSVIREYLSTAQIAKANVALGRPYSLSGKVVSGRQLGRTIGFPTANISPIDSQILIPASGAYAVTITTHDGIARPAMLNVGSRPTVDNSDAPISIEAHIFDYNTDIYGTIVAVAFYGHLRPERRFPSVEALRAQLANDADDAKKILARLA